MSISNVLSHFSNNLRKINTKLYCNTQPIYHCSSEKKPRTVPETVLFEHVTSGLYHQQHWTIRHMLEQDPKQIN